MPTIERDGVSIHYEDRGEGLPVIFGHSFLANGEMWRHQVDALCGRHRTINVDHRGHGRSGPVGRSCTLYDMADDMLAVLDHAGIASAVWAGLSIGGMIAMRAALVAPERVRGLVIVDSHAGAEKHPGKLRFGLLALGALAAGFRPLAWAILPHMFGRTAIREQPELIAAWRAELARLHVPSMLRVLAALMRRDDIVPRLGSIRAPALVLVGDEDHTVPVSCSRRIAASIPGARLEVLPRCGHLSALEQPAQVTAAMEAFLARHPDPG